MLLFHPLCGSVNIHQRPRLAHLHDHLVKKKEEKEQRKRTKKIEVNCTLIFQEQLSLHGPIEVEVDKSKCM